MTCRRSDIVDAGSPGVYHCISRCVRRESLIEDPARRAWIVTRLQFLASWMAVDVVSFAVMRNHIHLLLAIRPDIVAKWSDREVAERRASLLQNRRVRRQQGIAPDAPPTPAEIGAILASPVGIARARADLCSLGFLHRLLKEPCARMWNRQDRVTGHFWEGRFKSPRVLDLQGLVHVARYIELNEVHAGAAATVQESAWTSASVQWSRLVGALREVGRAHGDALTPELVAAHVLGEGWRPAIPCRASRSAAVDASKDRSRRPKRMRRPPRPALVRSSAWAVSALGPEPGDDALTLVSHLHDLNLSGRFARPDKSGRIQPDADSPLRAALLKAFEVPGDSAPEVEPALQVSGRASQGTRATVEFVDACVGAVWARMHPRSVPRREASRDAPPRLVATSRGTCYGDADSVAREARRRGRGRLWVGLLRSEPEVCAQPVADVDAA